MKKLILAAALGIPFAASAAPLAPSAFKDCSMKASKLTSKAKLLQTAKVKEAEAKTIALGTAGPGASIVRGGIETERGCLVYSYHVKDPAKSGQVEVFVDAGNGLVLKQETEGAMRAAVEKPVSKVKEVGAMMKQDITGTPSTSHSKPQ